MSGPLPLVEVLTRTDIFLRGRGVPSPRLEAELLLCHVLGLERLQLYLAHDRPLGEAELEALRPLVRRRGNREPLSWILGSRGFHDIELLVRPGVLDPRPDTETLVEAALSVIDADDPGPIYVADVGSGTGAVGLAIAAKRPAVRVFAIDIDPTAVEVTRLNVAALELGDRVAVLRGSLLDPVPRDRRIDWVVSNPPYIPTRDIDALQPEVSRHEPRRALDGGPDGLQIIRELLKITASRARRGVLLEVGHDQAARVADLLRRGGFQGLETWDDLASIHRVVGGRVPERLPRSGGPW